MFEDTEEAFAEAVENGDLERIVDGKVDDTPVLSDEQLNHINASRFKALRQSIPLEDIEDYKDPEGERIYSPSNFRQLKILKIRSSRQYLFPNSGPGELEIIELLDYMAYTFLGQPNKGNQYRFITAMKKTHSDIADLIDAYVTETYGLIAESLLEEKKFQYDKEKVDETRDSLVKHRKQLYLDNHPPEEEKSSEPEEDPIPRTSFSQISANYDEWGIPIQVRQLQELTGIKAHEWTSPTAGIKAIGRGVSGNTQLDAHGALNYLTERAGEGSTHHREAAEILHAHMAEQKML